ncbi:restriction endonuclease subunit S [Aeromonas media]|uniref:restriction endonuclease subunit S n=1 Tax=Aeromonas rivipollensis TaxID=948519 RepID=UPI0038D19CEF
MEYLAVTPKYITYSEYKPSQMDFLAFIPSHWEMRKLRYLFSFCKGLSITKENLRDTGVPCISYGEVHSKYRFSVDHSRNDLRCVDEKYLKTSLSSLLKTGDIVFADTSEDLDGSGNFSQFVGCGELFAGYHTIIAQPVDRSCWRFYAYLLDSKEVRSQIQHAVKGVKVFSITQDILRNIKVWLPSMAEQEKIANCLDHETAKIDSLIDKQERLVKLLQEKRKAVINHAVTKGLNPDVPMKESGVEWLGAVPNSWIVKSYRYACRIYRGKFGHRPRNDPAFYDGDYPFIQTGDVARAGKVISSYSQTLNEKGKDVSQLFPAGTLMMAIAANIGDIAILGFEAYAPDSVVGFKPYANIDIEFLRYSFMAALPALEQTSTQSTQANLNIDRIGSVKAVFPPYEQQLDIVRHLDKLLNHYDLIEFESIKAITLMQERRSALISAAVTGKIDVRQWQTPTSQVCHTTQETSL